MEILDRYRNYLELDLEENGLAAPSEEVQGIVIRAMLDAFVSEHLNEEYELIPTNEILALTWELEGNGRRI